MQISTSDKIHEDFYNLANICFLFRTPYEGVNDPEIHLQIIQCHRNKIDKTFQTRTHRLICFVNGSTQFLITCLMKYNLCYWNTLDDIIVTRL